MIKFSICFYLTFLYIDMFTNLSLMYKYRIIEHLEKLAYTLLKNMLPKSYMYIGEEYLHPLKRLYVLYVDYYIT